MFAVRQVIVIVLGVCFVKAKEDAPYSLEQNYSRVFKDMPALFEHIMTMLQEKPEVLERNDVITFYDKVSPVSLQDKLNKREVNLNYDSIAAFEGAAEAEQPYNMFSMGNNDFEGFIGPVGADVTKLISADEMVDMMLMVEEKLEERNNDND